MTARGHRLRAALVTVQVTVAVILVMVGGFAWESLRQTLDREGNFGRRVHYDVERLSTVRVDLRYHGYNEVRARAFLHKSIDELRPVSGIERVALGDILPGGCTPGAPLTASCRTLVTARDRDGSQSTARRVNVTMARASAGYLETTGLALMRGRDFDATDAEGAPRVAIVSERVAERLWPGENPLGQPLMLAARDIATVVGVSADPVSAAGNSALPQSHFVMIPFAQWPAMAMRIVVRTQATDGHLETVRSAIRRLDDDVAVLEAGVGAERVALVGEAAAGGDAARDLAGIARPRDLDARRVRRDRVLRQHAHPGVRDPAGARFDATRRREARPRPGDPRDAHRPARRRLHRHDGLARDSEPAVRLHAERDRDVGDRPAADSHRRR